MTATTAHRVGWAVRDGWTITRRDLAHWARQPGPVIVNLLFPVLMVLMFGYLFGGAIEVPGGGDYREFLMPGMFAMTVLFGLEATMIAVTTDVARGVTDRFRSMPMAPSAVVSGRSGADMINGAAGLAVMIVCGLLVGWRWHDGIGPALLAVALLLLLRFALIWVGVYLGLLVKGPESVVAVQILVWPFGFLSNMFVAPGTMPGWLGTLAEWNPLSSTVSAARELFGNPGWGGESWIAQHALLMALAWPALLLVIFVPLSVRRYRRLSR
jgi:ABC-2 type transport system permease protein